MSQVTIEEINAELRRRGVSQNNIGLSQMDSDHNEIEEYLKTNIGLQGDPAYQKALSEYEALTNKRAQAFSDMQAQMADDPSVKAKIDAAARGAVEGAGQMLALPAEAINASPRLLNFVPGAGVTNDPTKEGFNAFESFSDAPFGGSKGFRNVIQSSGLGYYKQPSRLGLDDDSLAELGDMPPSTRPAAVFGEEVGMSLVPAGMVMKAAGGRTALQIATLEKSANPVNQMIAFAAKKPGANASLESAFAALSGTGAAVAEATRPGDSSARMLGSIATPLAPIALPGLSLGLIKLAGGQRLERLGTNIKIKLGDADSVAAKLLQQTVVDAGGDPTKLAKGLEKFFVKFPQYRNKKTTRTQKQIASGARGETILDPKTGSLSPGMITNDSTLLAVERTLIANDSKIKSATAQQTRQAIDEMNNLYNQVLQIKGANPEFLRTVAQARMDQMNISTAMRVKNAVDKANVLQSRLQGFAVPGVPQVKEKTARQIKKIFDDTYTDIKKDESLLWDKVDKTLRVTPSDTEASLLKIASEPEGMLGINLTDGLRKLTKKTGNTSVSLQSGDLLKARSEVSSQIRNAMVGTNPNRDLARRLHIIETGILNDLGSVGAGPQLTLANNATRNKYQFLSLPPVSKMFTKSLQGNLPKPDIVLDKLLTKTQQEVYQTFDDLMEAGAKGVYQKDMRDPLARFYYAMANETIQNGSVNAEALGKFLNKHTQGLKDLGIYNDLKLPEAQAHLVKRLNQWAENSVESFSKSVAGRVLKTPRVDKFIGNILSGSKKRYIDLRDSVNLARKHTTKPQRAVEGIQQSVVENLLRSSTVKADGSGFISGTTLLNNLAQKQGKRTLEQDLIASKLMTPKQVKSIKKMAKRAQEFEAALASRSDGNQLKSIEEGLETDMFVDIVGRLAGATLASNSVLAGGAPSLIVAHIGSKAGQKFLDKMPTLKLRQILSEAMLDPILMQKLLLKPTSVTARKNNQKMVKYILASKGILNPDEEYHLENPEAKTQQLKVDVLKFARAGKNKLQIMDLYEEAARKPNSDIGPYMLDQVQSLIGVDDEQRAKIMKQYEDKKMDYFLKRRGRFQEKENPQAMFP
jgi:hypothetical protein